MNLRNMTISELLRQETNTELETVLMDQFTKILDQVLDLKDKLDDNGRVFDLSTADLDLFKGHLGDSISFSYQGSMANYVKDEYSLDKVAEMIKKVDSQSADAYKFFNDEILADITEILENFS